MKHRKVRKPDPSIYPPHEWKLVEKRYNPHLLDETESIYSVGNGYIGIRGGPEEGVPSFQNGTYVNGFYESWDIKYAEEAFGYAKTGQTIVSLPDSKKIKVYVDDEAFYLPEALLLQYERSLNMQSATLDREIIWETSSGKRVRITSRRLVSFTERHLAAMSYEIEILNADAPVVISSEILYKHDKADRGNDPRRAKSFSDRILIPCIQKSSAQSSRIVLSYKTRRSQMVLACGMDHTLDTANAYTFESKCNEDFGAVVYSINAKAGKPILLHKFITYHDTKVASPEGLCDRAQRTLDRARSEGFAAILADQKKYMDQFWNRSDIEIADLNPDHTRISTTEVQQSIRFNLFHILQAVGRADNHGVPAKGLTGHAYEGQYFWDTEIYVLPFLIYTSPRLAKNLLRFRYNMLDRARQRAKDLNQRGAMFPWRTINGEEASAYYAAGTAQYHINADIMHALKKYVNATDDREFLYDFGVEMLVETARLWFDLGFFSEFEGGSFCIHGVTGPDEYNTVVDNNTYTNVMARENLRFAATAVLEMKEKDPAKFSVLVDKTNLVLAEVEDWQHAANKMHIPFDEKLQIHLQDDSFHKKEKWDFENTPEEHYPLLLHYHPLVIYRYQVIKQADVVLAMFLQGSDFSHQEKKRNFDYYDPLTTGDSSLSTCIQSIIASELGYFEKANLYARESLLMDIADISGNVNDGCHIASMGGTWMLFTYGYGGMRDHDGILSFHPRRALNQSGKIKFPLTYRGHVLDVEIDGTVRYNLREGEEIVIRHKQELIRLTKDHPEAEREVEQYSHPDELGLNPN